MPHALFFVALGVLVVDLALREWKPLRKRAAANAVYLLIAYGSMFALPFLPRWFVTVGSGVAALTAFWSFARMVGLSSQWRFFWPSMAACALFFVVAHFDWMNGFEALPVFSILLVIGAAAARKDVDAFLQKMCLSWLGILVYGYLWGHFVLFLNVNPRGLPNAQTVIAAVILVAKFADVAWVLVRRIRPMSERVQLFASPVGGALGGLVVRALVPPAISEAAFVVGGAAIGAGLGFGSHAYDLIVTDVLGKEQPVERPLKGTMLFGFAFALAVGFYVLRVFL